MTAVAMSERDLQALIIDAARLGGWLSYHTHDSRRSAPGWPDLVLVRPPEMIVLELKSEHGRVTPDQREWLAALDRCGVEVAVVRPDDAGDLVARLVTRPTHAIPPESPDERKP